MTKERYEVIGIMIAPEKKDYQFYNMSGNCEGINGLSAVEVIYQYKGLTRIKDELNTHTYFNNAQFFIIYEVSCPDKEKHLNDVLVMLEEINRKRRRESLPILISIGTETTPLGKEIADKCIIKSTQRQNFREILLSEIHFLSKLDEKKCKFAIQLDIVEKKAKQLRQDGHITAADKADTLRKNLINHSQAYFSSPELANYQVFKREVRKDIEEVYEELSLHRGWKRLLGNIALAILGFGILYLAAVMWNRNVFFNKTDSAEKLDKLQHLVETDAFQIHK